MEIDTFYISIAPSSLHTQTILARKCSHDSRNESQFYFINSTGQGCNLIDDWSSPKGNQIETENSSIYFFQVVFFQLSMAN